MKTVEYEYDFNYGSRPKDNLSQLFADISKIIVENNMHKEETHDVKYKLPPFAYAVYVENKEFFDKLLSTVKTIHIEER